MRITFALNGVYLGMAAGLLAGLASKNAAVGVVVAVVVSVAAWYGIRALEVLLGRSVNAGFTAVTNWLNRPRPGQLPHIAHHPSSPSHGTQPSELYPSTQALQQQHAPALHYGQHPSQQHRTTPSRQQRGDGAQFGPDQPWA